MYVHVPVIVIVSVSLNTISKSYLLEFGASCIAYQVEDAVREACVGMHVFDCDCL